MSGMIARPDECDEDPLPVPNTGPAYAVTSRRAMPLARKAILIGIPATDMPNMQDHIVTLALRRIKEYRR